MHKLRINPVAKKDLQEIKEYISKELLNPDACSTGNRHFFSFVSFTR